MSDDSEIGGPLPFAHYDRRNYYTASVAEGYAGWSKVYGDFYDAFDIPLLERSPLLRTRVAGARVLDMACGTGRIGTWARRQGAAQVLGVDLSPDMMALAEARGTYDALHLADVNQTPLEPACVDGVLCSMALCHVEDLGAFFSECARLLTATGWLAFVDYHPFFLLMGIPSHYDDDARGESVAVTNHVHPLSEYINSARARGFELSEIEERFVTQPWIDEHPSYQRYLGLPITHFMAFTRSG